ncbi:metallophosphoesterase family protein [Sinisalibacter lacisalsi]|uniref:Serine/threonine protein phosphatase n=1 Tax=Sinisalibacter lacisalsi TaxID=1526570 RepID=A0ABQ1QP03_9RHOB|nr:metallophosphoesterase family protein [Sinisalibacter lacisalsi]GGD37598.1 serine/threonine protein phosphatase [Sinisalibacter lacisalsi]
MRILAFSDLHMARARAADLVAASREADLVIGAGDFGNMRRGVGAAMAMLAGIEAPLVMVPGNNESEEELRAAAPEGAHVLHGAGIGIGGLRIFGLGGGVPVTPFGPWSWDLTEDEAAALLAGSEGADIIVSHSPPKGIADRTSSGLSVGSTAVRDAVDRVQPRLLLCGHIHDCWGEEARRGATRIVNLGPTVNWFELEGTPQ